MRIPTAKSTRPSCRSCFVFRSGELRGKQSRTIFRAASFVRAALRSVNPDYGPVTIEHRTSKARQSDARLSHEFQTLRGTGITTREHRCSFQSSTASRPLLASPTTVMSALLRWINETKPSRTTPWSSAISTRMRPLASASLLKHFKERPRHLCSRKRRQVVNDEEGNPLQSKLESLQCFLLHLFFSFVPVQKYNLFGLRKANFGCDLGQNIVSTYVATFGEIGPEECFREMILTILLFGPPQQPMPGQRIGRHENLVVVKFDSETLAGRFHFGIHAQGPLPTAEFLGPVCFAIHALNRNVGIES